MQCFRFCFFQERAYEAVVVGGGCVVVGYHCLSGLSRHFGPTHEQSVRQKVREGGDLLLKQQGFRFVVFDFLVNPILCL